MPNRTYTRGEKAQLARLLFKGTKNAYGDVSDIEKRIDRINEGAEQRWRREHDAHTRQIEHARNAAAAARVAERSADRASRSAARDARRKAEQTLRRVEQAARRAGH